MKTIRQTATIRGATPHDIYEMIMDSKKHTKLAGSPTTVSRRVGGAFKVGRDLEGTNLKITKDRKIVQSWRANDWPKDHYSRATFSLSRAKGGTRITSLQSGVRDRHYGSIRFGWRDCYWTPLKKTFAN
jgi:activator of HSP90 ATPase